MKLDTDFEISVKCKHFKNGGMDLVDSNGTFKLKITKEAASNFIFRFAPSVFKCDKYNVVLKFNDENVLETIILVEGGAFSTAKNILVINDYVSFLSTLVEEYNRIVIAEKAYTMLNLGLNSDNDEVVDEFDLEKEE